MLQQLIQNSLCQHTGADVVWLCGQCRGGHMSGMKLQLAVALAGLINSEGAVSWGSRHDSAATPAGK